MAAGEGPARPGSGHARSKDESTAGSRYEPLLVYETILEHTALSLTVFDADLTVRDMSAAAAEQVGLDRERMVGVCLRDTMPEEYVEACERVVRGEVVEGERKLPEDVCPAGPITKARMHPLRDTGGTVRGGLAVITDVTEERRSEKIIEELAFGDPLTGLPNRRMASMMLEKALSGTKGAKRRLALVWLNLDRFKDVNDALGHEAGDQLLRAVGDRLHESLRTNDMVTRVGGDDFLLVLPRITSRRNLESLMGRIHAVFETPFIIADEPVLVTASCGVAVHPNGGSTAHEIEAHAHTAMRAAKALGGGACELYDEGFVADASHRLRLVREIRDGIDAGHFRLHFQPQLDLQTMRIDVVEALARWAHPERGLLSPAEFIPFAEETAMILPLGRHLLGRASSHHAEWVTTLPDAPRVAVNVSAREVQRSDVCGEVERAANAAGIPASALEIEITETAVLADPQRAAGVAACLRGLGATVALDDFGTGYSSLTHLRELPIDAVKIDRSFVAGCLEDRSAAAILVGVTHIAHDLGIKVVAEGVETKAQLDFVRAIGCDAAQGYHLAQPLTHEECTDFLLRAQDGPIL